MEATPAYLRREARDDELARSLVKVARLRATLTRFQSFDGASFEPVFVVFGNIRHLAELIV